MIKVDDPAYICYNDLPVDEQERWSSLLVTFPVGLATERMTTAGYLAVPSTYLICRNDTCIPVELQETMLENAKAVGANFMAEYCDSGSFKDTISWCWLARPVAC